MPELAPVLGGVVVAGPPVIEADPRLLPEDDPKLLLEDDPKLLPELPVGEPFRLVEPVPIPGETAVLVPIGWPKKPNGFTLACPIRIGTQSSLPVRGSR